MPRREAEAQHQHRRQSDGGDGPRLDRKHKALEFNRKVRPYLNPKLSAKVQTVLCVSIWKQGMLCISVHQSEFSYVVFVRDLWVGCLPRCQGEK